MSMRYKGGVISATAPTITAPVDGEGGTASGSWTLQTQLQNSAVWPKPPFQGRLYGWGANGDGRIGSNTTVNRSSPVQVGALTTWSKVSAGGASAMATKTDGTLWTWGYNGNGELGQDNTSDRSSPVQVGALTTWSKISAGESMGAAIKTDGTLWVWGANAYGELGLDVSGALGKRSSPVQVGALTTWSQIKAGTVATAALKTDGTLWLWGRNNYGQLGQNIPTSTNRSSPVQVGALTTWSKIANSGYHVVAIKTDGTLWSWGANGSGQLGLGNTVYRSSPVQVGALTTWSDTAVGAYFTMATKTDGTLWTWGNNAFGELGQGTATGLSSPVQVGALTTWSNIAGGDRHTMATKTDGTLWTWGRNQAGQLGLNDAADPFDVPINRSSPVQVGALTTWSRVSGGTNFSMALTAA
jgi:hypothetical protein